MFKKNKKAFFIIVILSLILLIIYFKKEKCENIDCISFTNQETYQLKEVFNNQDNSYLAEYSNENSTLRIEIINQNDKEAENLIRSRIARIKNQYEENISPYPGEISDSIICPPGFKPEVKTYKQNNINVSSFLIKLNDRMVTGQCEENLIRYHSYNYYFHCQNKNKTFLIETIYDKNLNKIKEINFNCN